MKLLAIFTVSIICLSSAFASGTKIYGNFFYNCKTTIQKHYSGPLIYQVDTDKKYGECPAELTVKVSKDVTYFARLYKTEGQKCGYEYESTWIECNL